MILAGDIGGTHTRLALFEKGKMLSEKKFPSREYAGLEEIVQQFLQAKSVAKACFGIAGPVREGRCQATNLPWIIDAAHLSRTAQIPSVSLLNDLEANAYGIRMLKSDELALLQKGDPSQKGNQALIAAGTGLGEAGLYWDGKEHRPFACEGGHADFAPRNAEEFTLLQFLQKKYGHVSYERVVSGPGIYEIYRFLVETGAETSSLSIQADNAKLITENTNDPACARAVDWFLSLYGAEAGNLALKILALGGIFIGGGIAPVLAKKMQQGAFLSSFLDKGRFQPLLASIPIHIILNDNAALLGAAYFAEHSS